MKSHILKLIELLKKKRKNLPFVCLGLVAIIALLCAECPGKEERNLFLLDLQDRFENKNVENIFLGPVASAREHPDLRTIEGNCLVGFSSPLLLESEVLATMSQKDVETAREIVEYTVKEGDNLWSIASRFNVSVDTVVWANDIENQIIRSGQKLIILPVSGVMHLVEQGDTIDKIAEKYEVGKSSVVGFNDLEDGRDLLAGEIIIVPGGEMPSNANLGVASNAFTNVSTNNFYGQSHAFPYGQCTWWVSQKRAIPAWGNAIDWLPNASASGYSTCVGRYCVPQVGAVISLEGHRVYGHVGYVESVSGDKVTFSEMNYIGLGKMNYRTVRVGSKSIKGYVY
jgi:surface antigen